MDNNEKTTKWITRFADNGWMDWICSNCGNVENHDVHVYLDWKYCPYCGHRFINCIEKREKS